MATKHTQLPWTVEGDESGLWISGPDHNAPVVCDMMGRDGTHTMTDEDVANAELIERAVNCHADLLAACTAALSSDPFRTGKDQITVDREAWDAMRAAIAKATPPD